MFGLIKKICRIIYWKLSDIYYNMDMRVWVWKHKRKAVQRDRERREAVNDDLISPTWRNVRHIPFVDIGGQDIEETEDEKPKKKINDPLDGCVCMACKSTDVSLLDVVSKEIVFSCNHCNLMSFKERDGKRIVTKLPDGSELTTRPACPRCNSTDLETADNTATYKCVPCRWFFSERESAQVI